MGLFDRKLRFAVESKYPAAAAGAQSKYNEGLGELIRWLLTDFNIEIFIDHQFRTVISLTPRKTRPRSEAVSLEKLIIKNIPKIADACGIEIKKI